MVSIRELNDRETTTMEPFSDDLQEEANVIGAFRVLFEDNS